MKRKMGENKRTVSRRDFIKASAAVSLATLTSSTNYAFAAGSDKLRVGLIGCGKRGTGAAKECVTSSAGVEIVAMGMGGREVRTGPEFGNIYDHFAVDFGYPNGVRVMSMCRQMEGCSVRISERVVGTKGWAYTDSMRCFIEGPDAYKYEGPDPNPYVTEHTDLIAGIRQGKPLNEARRAAESTLTAIMGRMSAYTSRALKWDWVMNASKMDLSPPRYEFGDLPVRPVAVPGRTRLV